MSKTEPRGNSNPGGRTVSSSVQSEKSAQPAPSRPLTTKREPPPYRVLVADDHAIVRHGLRLLLEAQPGIEVCWEAANGLEVLEVLKHDKPDLIILDATMPEMNGLEAVRQLHQVSPETAVLVLTIHFSEEMAREALRCGALAFVLKSDADADLLAAVDHVRHNQPFFTSRLTLSMARSYLRKPGDPIEGGGETGYVLTARETDVVRLLSIGKSNKEVAVALAVSTRTIESHRNHIMHKMNFTTFPDMVRFAVRHHLVDP